jgi:hypothetical protein
MAKLLLQCCRKPTQSKSFMQLLHINAALLLQQGVVAAIVLPG